MVRYPSAMLTGQEESSFFMASVSRDFEAYDRVIEVPCHFLFLPDSSLHSVLIWKSQASNSSLKKKKKKVHFHLQKYGRV